MSVEGNGSSSRERPKASDAASPTGSPPRAPACALPTSTRPEPRRRRRRSGSRAAWPWPTAGNVAQRADIRRMIDACVAEFGGLDVMFNNAGFNKPEPFLEITEEVWHQIMNVNALGVLMGCQEAAKTMIAQGTGGKIVNTASIAGRQGFPSFVPYCVSKFGVIAITQGAARALAAHKITVNAFAPGVVATPLWDKLDQDLMDIGDSERPGQAMEEFSAGILQGASSRPGRHRRHRSLPRVV